MRKFLIPFLLCCWSAFGAGPPFTMMIQRTNLHIAAPTNFWGSNVFAGPGISLGYVPTDDSVVLWITNTGSGGVGLASGTNAFAFLNITNNVATTNGTSYMVVSNWHNIDLLNFTGDATEGAVTNDLAGYYLIDCAVSFRGQVSGSPDYEIEVFTNSAPTHIESEETTTTANIGGASFIGILYLDAGTRVDIQAKTDQAGGAHFEIAHAQMRIVSLSGGITIVGDIGTTNAVDRFGLTWGLYGQTNMLKTISAGDNITLTNEGTNIVIASTGGSGTPDGVLTLYTNGVPLNPGAIITNLNLLSLSAPLTIFGTSNGTGTGTNQLTFELDSDLTDWANTPTNVLTLLQTNINARQWGSAILSNISVTGAITNLTGVTNILQPGSAILTNLAATGAITNIFSGATLFVMTNGNDSTGTRGRMDFPFLTLSNALFAATNGDAILIYPGEYIWNIGTNAYPHLISGKTNMAIVGVGKPTIYMSNSPYGQGIYIEDSRFITIDGLRLIGSPVKGQGDAGGNASCIRMDGANVENITVQNCDIIDWAGHGVTHLNPERGSSRNVYVLNNYFSNIGSTNADGGTIIDGAAVSGAGSDWIVSDNIITRGARGIEVEHIGYANSRGVLISGNILEGMMGQNIMVAVGQGGDALQQVYLSDNIIRGWLTNSYGIIATNDNYGIGILDCRNLVCKGNSIYDVWAAGISWAITTNSGVGLIMGNVVSGARWQGIQVRHSNGGTDNVKDVLIANNVTENTGFTGIETDASDVMIVGNRIKNAYNRDAAQSAIWLRQLYGDGIEPTNTVVMHNLITKDATAATTGIKVDNSVYDTKIFGNIFGAGIKPYNDGGVGTRYGIPTNNFMALSTDASPSSSDFLMVLDSTGSNVFKTAIGSLPFSLTEATNLVVASTNGVLTIVTNIYGTVSNNIYNNYSFDIFTAADEVTNYVNSQLLITNLYALNLDSHITNLTVHVDTIVSNLTVNGTFTVNSGGTTNPVVLSNSVVFGDGLTAFAITDADTNVINIDCNYASRWLNLTNRLKFSNVVNFISGTVANPVYRATNYSGSAQLIDFPSAWKTLGGFPNPTNIANGKYVEIGFTIADNTNIVSVSVVTD